MDLIDLSKSTNGKGRFPAFIDNLCSKFELEYASYVAMMPRASDVQFYANYPNDWVEHYSAADLQKFDPTIHMSVRSIAPVDWGRFQRDTNYNKVFIAGKDFGIPNVGVSVPIRGPYGDVGLLSVCRNSKNDQWSKLKQKIMGELQVAAVHMHDNVMSSGLLPDALTQPVLSQREKEILQWVAVGKSQQDIGDILCISHRTVEVHLRSGREKLKALTTSQAVGRAVNLGIIHSG